MKTINKIIKSLQHEAKIQYGLHLHVIPNAFNNHDRANLYGNRSSTLEFHALNSAITSIAFGDNPPHHLKSRHEFIGWLNQTNRHKFLDLTTHLERTQTRGDNPEIYFCLMNQSQLVGYITLFDEKKTAFRSRIMSQLENNNKSITSAYINSLAVSYHYQKNGYASFLLRCACIYARYCLIKHSISLFSVPESCSFYRKMGFEAMLSCELDFILNFNTVKIFQPSYQLIKPPAWFD